MIDEDCSSKTRSVIASNLEKIRTEIQLKNTSNKSSASRTRRSVLAVPGIKKSVKILTPKSINETAVRRRQIKKKLSIFEPIFALKMVRLIPFPR